MIPLLSDFYHITILIYLFIAVFNLNFIEMSVFPY